MNPWNTYRSRINAHGITKRDSVLQRERAFLSAKLPASLSYHQLTVNGTVRNMAVINSDNLNLKTLCTMPGEDLPHGGLVEWMGNHWLITEKDANNELYTKGTMKQCNYLLRWIAEDDTVVERWCVIEDGTKYLTGEYGDNDFIVVRGDSRISLTLAKDEYSIQLNRNNRFLIDDYDSKNVLAYRLTKPFKLGGSYNGEGVLNFVLTEGFEFSKRMLKEDLRRHFRRYGRDGNVILIDFKQFFPSVSHEEIFKRHEKLLLNPDIRKIGDDVVNTVSGGVGLPLGVEPSQAEMIAFPSALDNFIKCQLSIKCAGHYMDDYYVIVPPDRDAKEIMALIVAKAESLKLTVSKSKSRIVPLTKPFRYCKAKFILTETGRVVMNGNRDGVKRARRKIKAFRTKIQNGEMSYDDLWTSVNGMLAYFESYDDHNRVLRLRRLFYSVFGFSPERIENFRERGKKDEICCA